MGVSRAEWLWNSASLLLQNTGNRAEACSGLWWQKGKCGEQGERKREREREWEVKNEEQTKSMNAAEKRSDLCSGLPAILIFTPVWGHASVLFTARFSFEIKPKSGLWLSPQLLLSSLVQVGGKQTRLVKHRLNSSLVDLFWFPFTSTEQTVRRPWLFFEAQETTSLYDPGEAKVQS